MTQGFLPYGRQLVDEDDIAAVARVMRGDFLTAGPEIPAFEAEFCAYVGGGVEAVACSNGTTALHLALDALGLRPGEVAIVPSVTFMATANAARYCGAEVVFADVDPDTGLMTPDTLKAAASEARERFAGARIGAVLPVHLAGVVCDLEALYAIAQEAGAALVADSCHALGSLWTDTEGNVHSAGDAAFCDAATFSFHPVKTIACGEGGMVTTSNAAAANTMRRARSHNIERDPARMIETKAGDWPWYHEMAELGWNYRLPDMNAALGRSQLRKLRGFALKRRRLAEIYEDVLAPLGPLVLPPAGRAGSDACRHLLNARIDFETAGIARETVMERLRAEGIGTQVHYIPVHSQPYYAARYGRVHLPGAQAYYDRTLSLPLFPAMDEADPGRVAHALNAALTS